MEICQLRYFLKVAERRSFTHAGEELLVSQSALSRSIAKLEQEIGQPVFERQSRSLVLTDAGRDYLDACRQILEQVEEAERAASGAYAKIKGQLVVAAPIVFGRLHVVPVAAAFLEAHPEVDVFIQHGTAEPPRHATGAATVEYRELARRAAAADVVVTHGGLSSIMEQRSAGRLPLIVARDPDGWWQTLRLNQGSSSGVQPGMAVVAPEGLVGRTVEVSERTSEVLLVSDPGHIDQVSRW